VKISASALQLTTPRPVQARTAAPAVSFEARLRERAEESRVEKVALHSVNVSVERALSARSVEMTAALTPPRVRLAPAPVRVPAPARVSAPATFRVTDLFRGVVKP
jgi:hypothetical protein